MTNPSKPRQRNLAVATAIIAAAVTAFAVFALIFAEPLWQQFTEKPGKMKAPIEQVDKTKVLDKGIQLPTLGK